MDSRILISLLQCLCRHVCRSAHVGLVLFARPYVALVGGTWVTRPEQQALYALSHVTGP